MGSSSSQPVPEPKSMIVSTATPPIAERVPRYSPKMDDLAASQQLIQEGARAEHTMGDDGRVGSTSSTAKKHKTYSVRKSKKERPAASPAPSQLTSPTKMPPTLRSYALPDLQAYADSGDGGDASSGWPVSPLKSHAPNEVEVPDSQTELVTTHALMSPPMTSSFAIPASLPQKSSTYKKGKRRLRAETDAASVLPEQQVDFGEDITMGAHELVQPSPSPSPSKRTRRQPSIPASVSNEQDTIVVEPHSVLAGQAVGTPTSALCRRKSGQEQTRRIWEVTEDGHPEGEDEIVDGRSQGLEKKLRRLKKSKPRQFSAKLTHSDEGLEDELGDISGDNEAVVSEVELEAMESLDMDLTTAKNDNNDYAQAQEVEDPALKKHRSKKRKSKATKVHDWTAPVRNLDDPHDDTLNSDEDAQPEEATQQDEDAIFASPESPSCEDEIPSVPPPDHQTPTKKTGSKKVRKAPRVSENRRGIRKSNVDPTNTITAAERALNIVRELHHPPDLRVNGNFTKDEEELIRRAIRDYQERKGLDTSEVVDVIQWTNDDKDAGSARRRSDWTPQEAENEQESNEFWGEMKHINLTRKMERVKNHIRSQYHAFKSGGWTKEEDDQVKTLYELHPRQWKLISQAMGDRSMHDIHNRWRDYLQHGDKRNTSTWSQDEEQLLVRAITTVLQRDEDYRAEKGKPSLVAYTNRDINWAQVSAEMGNIRSRLQSSVKWTKMRARPSPPDIQLEIKPRKIAKPGAYDEDESPSKKKGQSWKSTAQQTPQPLMSAKQPRKHRKSKTANVTPIDLQEQDKQHPETEASTPLSTRIPTVYSTGAPGQMLWGDKFDLVEAIAVREHQHEQNIDWQDIAAAMKQSWSVRTLQATFQEIFELADDEGYVQDQEPFRDSIFALLTYLEKEHGAKLKEHYDPYEDAEPHDDIGPAAEGKEELSKSNQPNSKRKRKLSARGSLPTSRTASVKKRKMRPSSRPTTPKTPKSKATITESDDAESDVEL